MSDSALPVSTTVWVLSDGKIGDEVQCFGIADALGLNAERHCIAPRRLFALLMPYGPIDPRDKPHHPQSPIAPPFPDVAIAAGRRTVAYLKHLKKASGGRTFTVFVKDPYIGCDAADLIWVPRHDKLRGANVIVTPTPAHRMGAAVLEAARNHPDPRVAATPSPRFTMILGGPSQHHRYSQANESALAEIACQYREDGYSVLVTGSRRTPSGLLAKLKIALAGGAERHFIWDGTCGNPYATMLALADAILVTGDSVNMMAEAVATGAPVFIFEPDGGHRKMTAYIDYLVASGAARRWTGTPKSWSYAPIDSTPLIAAEVARRYLAWRNLRSRA